MKSVFYKPTKHQQIKSKKTDWNTTMDPILDIPKPTVICESTKKKNIYYISNVSIPLFKNQD